MSKSVFTMTFTLKQQVTSMKRAVSEQSCICAQSMSPGIEARHLFPEVINRFIHSILLDHAGKI